MKVVFQEDVAKKLETMDVRTVTEIRDAVDQIQAVPSVKELTRGDLAVQSVQMSIAGGDVPVYFMTVGRHQVVFTTSERDKEPYVAIIGVDELPTIGPPPQSREYSSPTPYIAVLRAAASVRFPKGTAVEFNVPGQNGLVAICFETRYETIAPGDPAPTELQVSVTGRMLQLQSGVIEALYITKVITPVLSFLANAPIDNVQPYFIMNTSPAAEQGREFAQFSTDEAVPFRQMRTLHPGTATTGVASLNDHIDTVLISAAVYRYALALRLWSGDHLLETIEHLYFAAKNAASAALASHLRKLGISPMDLAETWHIPPEQIRTEAQRRLVFRDDPELHDSLESTIDSNGILNPTIEQAALINLRNRTARAVRTSVVRELHLPSQVEARLLSDELQSVLEPFVLAAVTGMLPPHLSIEDLRSKDFFVVRMTREVTHVVSRGDKLDITVNMKTTSNVDGLTLSGMLMTDPTELSSPVTIASVVNKAMITESLRKL